MNALEEVLAEIRKLGRASVLDRYPEGQSFLRVGGGANSIQVFFSRSGSITMMTVRGKAYGLDSVGKRERLLKALRTQHRRGTSNADSRGNSYSRRRRKLALLARDGTGEWGVCSTCPTVVDFESATIDRWPLPGHLGGTYAMENIRLQCERCASLQGGHMAAARKKEKVSA